VAQGKEARGVGSRREWLEEVAPWRRRTSRVGGRDGVREAARRAAIYSQEREVRLQAFVMKDSQRYCCGTAAVPGEPRMHNGRPRADQRVFGGAADQRGRAWHVAREDVPRARRMDQRARARLGLRTAVERRGMA
jgi:hypothetical protein